MMRKILIAGGFLFFYVGLFAQSSPAYSKYYFRNPLGIPIELTSNFGELRPDHWHMGLDVRTRQKENLPIYAAAAGYISKVKIEPFAFGRSIIISHPNGLVTLYAHLNDFFPELEKYVTDQQYKNETWEIELNFKKNQFPVSKGQVIAYSGNTGGSQGPHLHFEIRTKENVCLNPLLFDFSVNDNTPPVAVKLAMYDRSQSTYDQKPQFFSLKKSGDSYIVARPSVIKTGLQKVSFAIQAFDREFRTGNPNGIYAAKIYFDQVPLIEFVLDSVPYYERQYINAQIDYKYRAEGGSYLQHLSLLPGNKEIVYKKINGNGVINLNDTLIHAVMIEIEDIYKNRSLVSFNVQFDSGLVSSSVENIVEQKFSPNEENIFKREDFEIEMPSSCLYDTVVLKYYHANNNEPFSMSAAHLVNDGSFPVHSNFAVRIKPNREIPEGFKEKLIMQRNGKYSIRKIIWEGEWATAKFGDFGIFRLFIDTIPPAIGEPESFAKAAGDTIDLSAANNIIFKPEDNFVTIKNFRAELDDKWLRFTNDKGRNYIYSFDERCPYGVHHLKIQVEDLVGNMETKEWWFRRNPYTPPPKKKYVPKRVTSQKKTTIKKN